MVLVTFAHIHENRADSDLQISAEIEESAWTGGLGQSRGRTAPLSFPCQTRPDPSN